MKLDHLLGCNRPTFDEFYAALRVYFETSRHFHVLEADHCEALPWPEGQGVYTVWLKENGLTSPMLVYVGMTGKFGNANGYAVLSDNLNGFRRRLTRTHPYSFTSIGLFADHFEFGPLFSLKKMAGAPFEARYIHRYPIRDLEIHCFVAEPDFKIAPAFVEALILQHYISSQGRMPEANNKF